MAKKLFFLLLIMTSFYVNSQEFTLKKSPEEKQREKELKEEKQYLAFQDHFFEAIKFKAKEDYNKAIQELEACKQIYPNDKGLNFEFAKNYYQLKDYENAIFFDQKILENEPKNLYVLEHLKKIYKTQRNFDEAIAIQQKIIAIKPSTKQDLIMLYIANRDREKAKEIYLSLDKTQINNNNYIKRILFASSKIKPKTTKPKQTVSTTSSSNNIKELQDSFKTNKNYKTLKTLLKAEEKQLQYNNLLTDSKKGLTLFPAQPFLYLMQGKAESKLLHYQNAIDVLKAGLDFIIDDNLLEIKFYQLISNAYLGLGNTKEATLYQEKIKKLQR